MGGLEHVAVYALKTSASDLSIVPGAQAHAALSDHTCMIHAWMHAWTEPFHVMHAWTSNMKLLQTFFEIAWPRAWSFKIASWNVWRSHICTRCKFSMLAFNIHKCSICTCASPDKKHIRLQLYMDAEAFQPQPLHCTHRIQPLQEHAVPVGGSWHMYVSCMIW